MKTLLAISRGDPSALRLATDLCEEILKAATSKLAVDGEKRSA